MKTLQIKQYFCLALFILTSSIYANNVDFENSTQPNRQELKSKRDYFSNSYLNSDGTITTEISSGFVHYKREDGSFKEIDRNFKAIVDNQGSYQIKDGLYHVYLSIDEKADYPVVFETKDSLQFKTRIISMGYIDSENKNYREIAEFDPDSMSAIDNKICYHNAFPGIDIVYEYQDTRLKENIILTPEARENLKSPGDVKIPFQKALLVFKIHCDFDDSLEVLSESQPLSNRRKMRSGNRIKNVFDNPYEGNEKIRFCNANGQMKYFLTEDIAYVQTTEDESIISKTHYPMTRRIITEKDENYILTGVPYEWLSNQKAGTIVLDPTVSIQPPTHDTFILDGEDSNFGGESELYLGNPDGTVKFRSLIKFNVDGVIPADTDINSASLMVYYYGYGGGGVISRTIQCHQVLKNWYEQYATWYRRESSTYWNIAGVGLNNIDATSTCESSQIFYNTYGWRTFDVKALTQKWLDGTASNYGVLLWATNESTSGDMKYIYSSEYSSSSLRPKLVINYTMNRNIATYTYDTYGRVSTATYDNGMTETNSYEPDRSWLTAKIYQQGGATKYSMSVADFDAVGNILEIDESYNSRRFSYDNLYRLVDMQAEEGNNESYYYDKNGNLPSVNANNNRMSSGTYDANGNLIEHDYSTITYDWRNLMTGYGSTWTYTYDAFGERVRKYEGSYRYYLTSGMNILEEYNNSQSLDAVHIYNGYMRLATLIPGDDIYYVCVDQIISSKALVDESGNRDQTRDYYPYGRIQDGSGSLSDYQYSGKELDATGFYYFGARYYDPNTKRWLSCDPAEQGWSPYVYCGGNPVNLVDPDGEFVIEALVLAYKLYQIYSYANMAYQMYDAYQHGGFGTMMSVGMQMGASYVIGSAVGGVMGGYGGGLLRDMTVGGVSVAVTGGTVSAMFGGSFKDGAISGGIGGALSAGISWTGQYASLNIKATAAGLNDDPVSQEDLHGFAKEYHNMVEGENGLRKLNTETPKGYKLLKSGAFKKLFGFIPYGDPAGGTTEYVGNNMSDVHIAPYSFSSERRLYLTLGHEKVHVYHYSMPKLRKNANFLLHSEHTAYSWQQRVAYDNGWMDFYNAYRDCKYLNAGYHYYEFDLPKW